MTIDKDRYYSDESNISTTPADLLKDVKEILKDPTNWLQGIFATDKEDRDSTTTDLISCKFCLSGAITHLYHKNDLQHRAVFQARKFLIQAINSKNPSGEEIDILTFNDEKKTTHEDVINKLDLAIELANKGVIKL